MIAQAERNPERSPKSPRLLKAWDTRGRITPLILPFVSPDRSAKQISELVPFTVTQVRTAIKNARREAQHLRPTKEETRLARSVAHKGIPTALGRVESAETLMKKKGRELSPQERRQIRIVAASRRFIRDIRRPSFDQFYKDQGRKPLSRGTKLRTLVEVYYAKKRAAEIIGASQVEINVNKRNKPVEIGAVHRLEAEIGFIDRNIRPTREEPQSNGHGTLNGKGGKIVVFDAQDQKKIVDKRKRQVET